MATPSLPKLDNLVSAIQDNINNKLQNYVSETKSAINTLQSNVNTKANDSDVVHTTGDETIEGTKTFSSDIVGNVTGNADTATTLKTTRSLWGNNFDGSQNLSGDIKFTNNDLTGAVVGIRGKVGGNGSWRVGGGATESDSGFMELATADNASEPIYVRQYTSDYETIVRTATLLDASGNTQFPGTVAATTFTGNVIGNCSGTAGGVAWNYVSGKPTTFTPSIHTHDDRYYTESEIDTKLSGKSDTSHTHDDRYYTESEIDTKLSGKSDTSHNHNSTYLGISAKAESAKSADSVAWNNVTGKPSTYAPSSHTHDDRYYTESEVNNLLGGKANSSHTHDDRYYTESEIDTKLSGKSDTSHNHNSVYLGKTAKAESAKRADSVAWNNVTGKPSTFAPSSHTHDDRYYTETEVNNLLGGKANSSHTHDDRYYTETEVNNLLSEYVKQTDMRDFNAGSCFIGFYSSVSNIDGVGSGGALTVGTNTSAANIYNIVAISYNGVTLSKNITLVGTWKLISVVSGRTTGGYDVNSISVEATNGPGASYRDGVLTVQGLFVRVA